MRRALLTASGAVPITIGAVGNFAAISPTDSVGPNAVGTTQMWVCNSQSGQVVTASGSGVITQISVVRGASSGAGLSLQFVVGTISGNNFTVGDFSAEFGVGPGLNTFSTALAVTTGQFVGVICRPQGSTVGDHVGYLSSAGSSMRVATASVTTPPTIGIVYTLNVGSSANFVLLVKGAS